MKSSKVQKPLVRDFIVYMITSVKVLLLKGRFRLFVKDVVSFFRWRVFRNTSKSTIDFQIPWMSFAAIDFLKEWLQKNMVVFEYGSGGSSLFIAERVQQLYSVDHDELWYNKVKELIAEKGIRNINYSLFKPEPVISPAQSGCGNPANYLSCMGEFQQLKFETYARSIDQFPANHFDLVIVDGRARPSCIKHAMTKVKQGGVLLLDNADRAYYLDPFPELLNVDIWKQQVFIGHFPYCSASVLDTTIFFYKQ